MSDLLYIFPTPPDAVCELRHDTAGWTLTAHPATHPTGPPCQVFDIPDGTPQDHGCALLITAPKKVPVDQHAALHLGAETYLRCDVFHLQDVPAPVGLARLIANGKFLEKPDA